MSIFKRKLKHGYSWRAVVRIEGYPTVCKSFERKQEAEDWEKETKSRIKFGQFKLDHHKQLRTFSDLLTQYISNGAIEHLRSSKDTLRHLDYWKSRLSSYALIHITPELIAKERQLLIQTPASSGRKRSNATINRYLASLSPLFTYAVSQLQWIEKNPCTHLIKLKENPGRDRVLSSDEIPRLLKAARQSRSPYLYCIILIALTTGARCGEILNLDWKHIDFANHIAYLKETKNGRPRSISLTEPVVKELLSLYEKRQSAKPLVFASRTAFGRIDIKKAWQQALRRASIAHCRIHDMRHTFATLAAAQGASNLELATAMGHRTLQMLQRYTHLDVQVTKKFSRQISESICQGEKTEPTTLTKTQDWLKSS